MVLYRPITKVNQSETILKYFSPLQTHKYHTQSHTLPDDGRSISQNVAEKRYDSRHGKLRKHCEYNWIDKGYDYKVRLSPRFFCIDAKLLCEFESDKILINEFE